MDAAAIAERQETDGLAWQAQRDLPGLSFPAGGRVDQEDQSDSARVGEILCHRPSSRCFSYIRYWVEKKIRRHLARACQRQGCGWKRWGREWLYGKLGLFSEYRISYGQSISAVAPVR